MSLWVHSKAWQVLLLFSCITLYLGVKGVPASAISAANITNANFSPPAQSNSKSMNNTKPVAIAQQSYDQTFDFSISTRLSVYPTGTEMHLIGVYQGDDGKKNKPWWSKCKHSSDGKIEKKYSQECHSKWAGYKTTETVKVNVELSTPSVLVLMANEPVIWTVQARESKLIKKIILVGLHAQQVKGLPNTPIEISTQKTSPTCSNCSLTGLLPVAYDKTNKSYSDVLKTTKKKTGLEAATFQGSRVASQFTISDKTPRISGQSFRSKYHLKEGDFIDRHYRNNFMASNVTIPLPEGVWIGLIYHSIGKDYGEDQALVFYQQHNDVLQGIFAVRLSQSLDGAGFPRKNACTDNVGYRSIVDTNINYGDQLCYWVEHISSPWETPIFELSAMRLDKLGITTPSIVINSAFHKANINSSITGYFLTNPEAIGINTQPSSWLTSPWHPRKIKSDTAKQRFVNDKVEWMDAWFQTLRFVHVNS